MKRFLAMWLLFVMSASLFVAAENNAQSAFDKMKSLDGTWVGKSPEGKPAEVSFRTTSGGSALMSEIKGDEDMITMFHMDGDRLLMTHYCGSGNQPRMAGTLSPDGKSVTFNFVDATNLASPETGHMHKVTFTMPDSSHHSEEWVFLDHGKEMTEHFELTRK